jgi:hypothetical protein
VELLAEIHQINKQHQAIPPALLLKAQQITDANAAIFDAQNNLRLHRRHSRNLPAKVCWKDVGR